jgi:putative transposase
VTDGQQQKVAPARQAIKEMVDAGLLDHLMSRVDRDGVALTGEGGLLPELVKAVLERGLQAELTGHLGYEKGDPAGRGSPNSRNGTTPKTLASEVGDIALAVPRDRNGSFEPRLVAKGSRRAGGLDDMIISLYAGGMTVRDIQHHLARTLGTELSHDTISTITDAVLEEVKAWQGRPLEEIYPIIYLDALVVKVRDGHQVRNKAAYLAVGVDLDGVKHDTYNVQAGTTPILVHNCNGGPINTNTEGVEHTQQRHFSTGEDSTGKSLFNDSEMAHQLAAQAEGTR